MEKESTHKPYYNHNMNKAGFEVIVGSFEKNGTIYHAAINAPLSRGTDARSECGFKVLLSHPLKKTVSFKILKDEHGSWIPDKRKLVDPWIADYIGRIIEDKVMKKDNL